MKDIDSKSEMARVFFNALFAILGTLSLIIFNRISNTTERVEKNVAQLNIQMATSIQLNENMKDQIFDVKETVKDHEFRIRKVEHKQ